MSIHLSMSISMYIYMKYLCVGTRDEQEFTTERRVCARRRIYLSIYLSIYMHTHIYIYIHIHTHIHIHTYIYVYI